MAKRVVLIDKETKQELYPRTEVASVEGLDEALDGKVSKAGNDIIDGIKEFSMGFHVQLGGIQLSDYHTTLEDYLDEYYPMRSELINRLASYYTKTQIDQIVEGISQFSYVVVPALPLQPTDSMMGKIYLVPSSNPATANSRDEYIVIENSGVYSWEQIGSTNIDLSAYSTTEQMNTAIQTAAGGKQDTISSVTVAVDDNTGTPAGSVAFANNTLAFSFQNLKGPQGIQGIQGPQGIQGERGAEGAAGITGDVSALNIRQAVDASTAYTSTDVAGAVALQYILTHEIEGGFYV